MVARRKVLGLSAGVLLGAALRSSDAGRADTGPVEAAPTGTARASGFSSTDGVGPGPAGRRGGTLAVRRELRRGRLRVPTASFPLTHLGLTWRGSDVRVRLRGRAGWGEWTPVGACGGGRDGRGRAGGSAVVVAPESLGYEVTVGGEGIATVTELDTLSAAPAAAAPASTMPLPSGRSCQVPYLSRAAWGADESLRFPGGKETWPLEHRPVQVLTVHHSAGVNGDPNPAATVRAIYYNQTVTQGWGDIGYHLLIDEAGRVYEGRASGVAPTPVFGPAGADGRPEMVVAGHIQGFNAGNIGVCLLGNLTSRQPTAAALGSLVRVLSALALESDIDVLATAIAYRNPDNGATRTVAAISGHRNWANTACPGDVFYPKLPGLRLAVYLQRNPVQTAPTPPTPRPLPTATATPTPGPPTPTPTPG